MLSQRRFGEGRVQVPLSVPQPESKLAAAVWHFVCHVLAGSLGVLSFLFVLGHLGVATRVRAPPSAVFSFAFSPRPAESCPPEHCLLLSAAHVFLCLCDPGPSASVLSWGRGASTRYQVPVRRVFSRPSAQLRVQGFSAASSRVSRFGVVTGVRSVSGLLRPGLSWP